MSHAQQGGQAPDQASSGRQTGAAVPPGRIIPKARKAASHPTSHKQHGGHQAGNHPRQTNPPTLTVPRRAATTTAEVRAAAEAWTVRSHVVMIDRC
jgi:hypothetical protein